MWFLLLVVAAIFIRWNISKEAHEPPPGIVKTKEQIENMLFHAPAQKAIYECRMAGASESSIQAAIKHHREMCKKGGIGEGDLI